MAEHAPITSPDQRKPGHPRAARLGAAVIALVLISMVFGGDRESNVSTVWLIAGAGLLLIVVVADWVLRRNGLR
jgi:hypothetical protein